MFFLWIAAIAFIYLAVGSWLFLLVDGIRRRKYWVLGLFAAGPVLAWIPASMWSAWLLRHGIHDTMGRYAIALLAFGAIFYLVMLAGDYLAAGKLTWQQVKQRKELSRQIRVHLTLITGAIIFSVPFYWLITTSLKPDERTNMFPPDLIPMKQRVAAIDGEEREVFLLNRDGRQVRVVKMAELEGDNWDVKALKKDAPIWTLPRADLKPDLYPVMLWKNYSDALDFLPPEYHKGLTPLWNTIYVTLLTIVGTVLSSSLVAFAFARLRWPGRNLLFVVLLATMMVPAAVTMLPVFLIFRQLNWVDTLKPLWVPAMFGSAFNVFLLRQFFLTIPNDLEDAAKIDGCSFFTIYWKIMLPLIKPALAALTIFAFMGSWNNFQGPLIYISSPEKMTLAYALQLFQGAHGGEPAMMMAAATLVMLPILAVFFFTQRYMIQGVTLTGIKG